MAEDFMPGSDQTRPIAPYNDGRQYHQPHTSSKLRNESNWSNQVESVYPPNSSASRLSRSTSQRVGQGSAYTASTKHEDDAASKFGSFGSPFERSTPSSARRGVSQSQYQPQPRPQPRAHPQGERKLFAQERSNRFVAQSEHTVQTDDEPSVNIDTTRVQHGSSMLETRSLANDRSFARTDDGSTVKLQDNKQSLYNDPQQEFCIPDNTKSLRSHRDSVDKQSSSAQGYNNHKGGTSQVQPVQAASDSETHDPLLQALTEHRAQLAELKGRYSSLSEEYGRQEATIKKNEEDLESAQQAIVDLNQELASNTQVVKQTVANAKAQAKKYRDWTAKLEEQIATVYEVQKTSKTSTATSLEDLSKELKGLSECREEGQKELNKIAERLMICREGLTGIKSELKVESNANQKLGILKIENQAFQKQMEELKEEVKRVKEENITISGKLHVAQTSWSPDLDDIKATVHHLKSDAADKTSPVDVLLKVRDAQKEQIEKLEAKVEHLTTDMFQTSSARDILLTEQTRAQTVLDSLALEGEDIPDKISALLRRHGRDLADWDARLRVAVSDRDRFETDLSAAETRAEGHQSKYFAAEVNLQAVKAELNSVKADYHKAAKSLDELRELQKQHIGMREHKMLLEQEVANLKKELAGREADRNELGQLHEQVGELKVSLQNSHNVADTGKEDEIKRLNSELALLRVAAKSAGDGGIVPFLQRYAARQTTADESEAERLLQGLIDKEIHRFSTENYRLNRTIKKMKAEGLGQQTAVSELPGGDTLATGGSSTRSRSALQKRKSADDQAREEEDAGGDGMASKRVRFQPPSSDPAPQYDLEKDDQGGVESQSQTLTADKEPSPPPFLPSQTRKTNPIQYTSKAKSKGTDSELSSPEPENTASVPKPSAQVTKSIGLKGRGATATATAPSAATGSKPKKRQTLRG